MNRVKKVVAIFENLAVFLFCTVVILFLMQLFCFTSFRIPSDSMEPALKDGDRILVNKMIKGARLFDVFAALNNEDITIYGDGKQTRSFQYIDDLIEGMIRMMNTEDEFTGPINLGNPNEFPVLELAERIISMTGSSSKIVFKSLPDDDPKQRQPDITLAKEKLGWQPTVELEEGLKRMIEYFKNV